MANADYTFDNIISSGSGSFKKESGFSASVRRMQTKLNRLGYDCGTADGYFGSNTDAQVRAFQAAYNLTVDGYAGAKTLSKLDELSPDSTTEKYGRELTHAQLTGGYSSSSMSATEALAKELYNRKNSSRPFDTLSGTIKTWKGIVFSKSQYDVMTGSGTGNSRKPNQYSSEWANCVTLAETLVKGKKPSSALANQCYHRASGSSYPGSSLDSTRVQIPEGKGNKFFDYQTTL